jgi:hypothetical protein
MLGETDCDGVFRYDCERIGIYSIFGEKERYISNNKNLYITKKMSSKETIVPMVPEVPIQEEVFTIRVVFSTDIPCKDYELSILCPNGQ